MISSELRDVQRAIASLAPTCRHLFLLRRVHDRSIGEIAEETGLASDAVRSELATAIVCLTFSDVDEAQRDAAKLFVARLDDNVANALHGEDEQRDTARALIKAMWDRSAGLKSIAPLPEQGRRPTNMEGMQFGADQ